ncbi:MAG: MATE family efflux transporter [Oscillospiraceae bacterium]|nr:MATE family efflux transporter [Oscillospiraceae bacterium]
MTETKVGVLVSKMAIPTIISMLITTFYNMADTYFVGHINTDATAAVGVVFPLMAIIQACGFFFGHGSGNYISKKLGQQQTDDAAKMASTAFFSTLVFGVFFMLVCSVFRTPLVYLLGATDKIAPYAVDYMQFILIGAPFYASSLVLNNQFRFQGNAVYAMVGITTGGGLNVALDWLFIFPFGLGVRGAAMATALSQFVSFCILLTGTFKPANISIKLKNFTPRREYYSQIIKGGAPSLLRQSLSSVTTISMNYSAKIFCIAAGFNQEAAIAAMTIVGKITMFAYSVVIGFGQGFQPVCGFNYGANKFDRVKKAFWFSVMVTTCFLIVAGILIYIYAPQIVGLFNKDNPQIRSQVISIGATTLRFTTITFPLVGFMVLSNMMMQNLTLAFRASLLAMARQGLFYIPCVLILPQLMGFTGIQMSQMVSDAISFVVTILLTVGVLKDLSVKIKDTN